ARPTAIIALSACLGGGRAGRGAATARADLGDADRFRLLPLSPRRTGPGRKRHQGLLGRARRALYARPALLALALSVDSADPICAGETGRYRRRPAPHAGARDAGAVEPRHGGSRLRHSRAALLDGCRLPA